MCALLRDIRTNKEGSLHSLIYGKELAKAAENIERITQDLSKATDRVSEVRIHKLPVGSILPTGSEIRPVGSPAAFCQILDANSLYIERTIEVFGGITRGLPPVPDKPYRILEALREALQVSDFLFIVAGTSAGRLIMSTG